MQQCGGKSRATQGRSQLFGKENRTVAPAGAANCNVYIGFALRFITRQQEQHEVANAFEGFAIGWIATDMVADGFILPSQWLEVGLPVRIIEKAHVEHQIGDRRHAARKAEARDRHGQRLTFTRGELLAHHLAQFVD